MAIGDTRLFEEKTNNLIHFNIFGVRTAASSMAFPIFFIGNSLDSGRGSEIHNNRVFHGLIILILLFLVTFVQFSLALPHQTFFQHLESFLQKGICRVRTMQTKTSNQNYGMSVIEIKFVNHSLAANVRITVNNTHVQRKKVFGK